jgi:acyl-CoA thioesterase-1
MLRFVPQPSLRHIFVSLLVLACASVATPQAVTPSTKEQKLVLFIGDSLTAGYGVNKEQAFPDRIGVLLKEKGLDVKVVNGGISGSVSAEADARVRWFLKLKPTVLVLALGSNDALKGTPTPQIKKNLGMAIDLAKASGLKVILCGQKVFSNFGPEYSAKFETVYTELAKEKKVDLMPFLLEDVALKKDLNIADGKHPNPKGHDVIAKNLAPYVEKALKP